MSSSNKRKQRCQRSRTPNPTQGTSKAPEPSALAEPARMGRWVTLAEIADRLDVCTKTLRNWEKKGIITLRRVGAGGRLVGMTQGDFESWMDSLSPTDGGSR